MKAFVTVLAFFLSIGAFAQQVPGNEGGNGGNGLASNFAGVANRALRAMKLICAVKDSPAQMCKHLPSYEKAWKTCKVVPRDTVLGPDGNPRDAINDGKSEIQVNTFIWESLLGKASSSERRVRDAVHEFAVVAGIERGDNYQFSDEVLQLLAQNYFSLQIIADSAVVRQKPEMPSSCSIGASPRIICFEQVFSDSGCSVSCSEGYLAFCYPASCKRDPNLAGGTVRSSDCRCRK